MKLDEKQRPGLAGAALGNSGRFAAVMILLSVLLLVALILNVNIGSVSIPTGEILKKVGAAVGYGIGNLFTGGGFSQQLQEVMKGTTQSQILFSIRIPRMLLAAVLGGALSVSGYLLQVFFRNPIAGPFVLGISSGAKMVVGVTLIFLAPYLGSVSSVTLVLAAFLGSLLITSLVLVFAQKVHSMSMLLVIGIMVGYICGAITDFCVAFAKDNEIANLTSWSMGSFSGASWDNLGIICSVVGISLLVSMLISKPMDAYQLGEGYARSMGINIRLFRTILIVLSSILSACVTAFAGPISFVGIAVPQIAKVLMKTSKPIVIIPTTFLCGSVFCIFCDLIARTAFAPMELAIGTVTSAFGAPVVISLMLKRNLKKQ